MFQKSVKVVLAVALSILHVVVFCGQGYAAPTITLIVEPDETDIYLGSDPIALTVEASGTNLKYEWSLEGPGEIEGEGTSVLYKLPESIEGESAQAVVTVAVTDEQGEKSTGLFACYILKREEPKPAAEEIAEEPAEETAEEAVEETTEEAAEEPAKEMTEEPAEEPAEETAEEPEEEKGMSKTTKIAIGAGAAAAVGLGVALAVGGGDDEKDGPFDGTFRGEGSGTTLAGVSYRNIYVFKLSQSGSSISGTLEITSERIGCCTAVITVSVTGTADGNSGNLSWEEGEGYCECGDTSWAPSINAGSSRVTISDDGQTLSFDGGSVYTRAKMAGEYDCTLVPISEFMR